VARKKHQPDSAAVALDEIESQGDRLVAWVTENPKPILGTAAAIILVAAVWGISAQMAESKLDASAAALAQVQEEYRVAMGASPGAIEIPEPANPETARSVRADFVTRYEAVAEEHAGEKAAALALIEAAGLEIELGQPDAALARYDQILATLDENDVIRAFALVRLGGLHESQDRFAEAGDAYAAASEIAGYPLRFEALADAARVYATAGNRDAALAAFARIEAEAPDFQLAPYLSATKSELGAARQ